LIISFGKDLNLSHNKHKMMKNWFYICVIGLSSSLALAQPSEKIDGVSFVSSHESITDSHIQPIRSINANWTALSPFAFMASLDNPEVRFNIDRQWRGERVDGIMEMCNTFKKNGIKIMLKPQIWIRRGEFTGQIMMKTDADWQAFEKNYTDFILTYAKVAEEQKIELFSIGTELASFAKVRPDYWAELIKKVRAVYKGKLTYAENWDTYDNFPHWKKLDFIGIDAYFPLSEEKTPSVAGLIEAWKPYKEKIIQLSQSTGKKVLFTEYGYRSVDYTAKEPWNSSTAMANVNFEGQQNGLEAINKTFWGEAWFEGGFLWKWFHKHSESGGKTDSQYTVQNKPAEALIRSLYKR